MLCHVTHSDCSNVTTWQVHNALLLTRISLKHFLENLSEMEAILQLDGAKTVQQITSLESATPTSATPTGATPTSASVSADSSKVVPKSAMGRVNGSEMASGSEVGVVRASASGGQVVSGVSGSLASVSGSDLDLMACQAAGVAGR